MHRLPEDFAAWVRALNEREPDYIAEAMPALLHMADQAEDAAKLYQNAIRRTWELSHHKIGIHREMDRRMAERNDEGVITA